MDTTSPDAGSTGILGGFFSAVNQASASYNAFMTEKDKRNAGTAQTSQPAPGTISATTLNPQTLVLLGGGALALILAFSLLRK